MSSFATALAAGPLVLDGGLGTLLEARGHDLSSSLWSAQLLIEQPDAIRRAHAEYYAAGARVAITSSYQVSCSGMESAGYRRSEVDAVLARSVQLARQAREDSDWGDGEAWVAASIGPFGASLADGSEYTGRYGLGVAQLRDWHRPRIAALVAAAPDVLAVETVPSLAELEAVCRELAGVGVPAWVSVTIADGALRSGESLAEAFEIMASAPEVIAVGVNCCDADEVAGALAVRGSVTTKPGVAYPNSGEHWHADTRSWSGTRGEIAHASTQWVTEGARLVGGCCRVGPAEIADLARAVAGRA